MPCRAHQAQDDVKCRPRRRPGLPAPLPWIARVISPVCSTWPSDGKYMHATAVSRDSERKPAPSHARALYGRGAVVREAEGAAWTDARGTGGTGRNACTAIHRGVTRTIPIPSGGMQAFSMKCENRCAVSREIGQRQERSGRRRGPGRQPCACRSSGPCSGLVRRLYMPGAGTSGIGTRRARLSMFQPLIAATA